MYSVLEDGEIYVTALTYFEEAEGDFLNDNGQPYKSFEELSEDILWNEDKFFSAYSRNGIRGILDNPKLLDNQKEIIYDAYKNQKKIIYDAYKIQNEILYQNEQLIIINCKDKSYIRKLAEELGCGYNCSINIHLPSALIGKIEKNFVFFSSLDDGVEDFLEDKKRLENIQKALEKALGKSLESTEEEY